MRASLDEGAAARADEDMARTAVEMAGAPTYQVELDSLGQDAFSQPSALSGDRLIRKKLGPAFWLSVTWLFLVLFAATFANILPIDNPNSIAIYPLNQAPTWQHWFGTDQIGHDIFSQVVYGARASMLIGMCAVFFGILIGGTFGLLAGFYRGLADTMVSWVTDVMLSIPGLILALVIVAFLGEGNTQIIVAITLLSIPAFARLARAASLAIAQSDFVLAAKALGAKPRRTLFRDVLPLVLIPIASYAALAVSIAILVEAALAFLGFASPGSVAWGVLISNGQQELQTAPQLVFAPAIVLFLTILSLNFIGQTATSGFDRREAQI